MTSSVATRKAQKVAQVLKQVAKEVPKLYEELCDVGQLYVVKREVEKVMDLQERNGLFPSFEEVLAYPAISCVGGGLTQTGKTSFPALRHVIAVEMGIFQLVVTYQTSNQKRLYEGIRSKLAGSIYEGSVVLACSGKGAREGYKASMSRAQLSANTVVAANTAAQLQDFLWPLSTFQANGHHLVWLMTTDEADAFEGTGNTMYEQALRVARNRLGDADEAGGFFKGWERVLSKSDQAEERVLSKSDQAEDFRIVPPYEMFTSATLLPSLLQLRDCGLDIGQNDIYCLKGSQDYCSVDDCVPLCVAGEQVFLDESDRGWQPWDQYVKTGRLSPKVQALIDQHVVGVRRGFGVFIVTSRTEGAGGSFRVAEKLRDEYAAQELSVVAVAAKMLKVHYWDRSELLPVEQREGHQHAVRNPLKRVREEVEEGIDHSDLRQWMREIQQHIGDRPLILLGWENIMRGYSARVDSERSITALVVALGDQQTFEAYLQAAGRATGNLHELLQSVHHITTVTVLVEEVDWICVQRYYNFQREVFRRLEAGQGLQKALGDPFNPDLCGHCNFLICRIPRKQRGKTTVRRIGKGDHSYQPPCDGEDPEVLRWTRIRRHNIAGAHLPADGVCLNTLIPELDLNDDDASATYSPTRVAALSDEALLLAAGREDAVVVTEVHVVLPEELGMGQASREEIVNLCRARSSSGLQSAFRHLLHKPTASVAGIEARRSRLLRKNPLLWKPNHSVDHFHDIFWRAHPASAEGELCFVVVVLRRSPVELQGLLDSGTAVVWHGVEASLGGNLPGITISDYSQQLSVEIRFQATPPPNPPPTEPTTVSGTTVTAVADPLIEGRRPGVTRKLEDYILAGYMEAGPARLSTTYRGIKVWADLLEDGMIQHGDAQFTAPSSFAHAAMVGIAGGELHRRSRSGWDCVFYEGERLTVIRKRAASLVGGGDAV